MPSLQGVTPVKRRSLKLGIPTGSRFARDSFWRDRDPSAARPPAQSTRIQQLPGALLQTPFGSAKLS